MIPPDLRRLLPESDWIIDPDLLDRYAKDEAHRGAIPAAVLLARTTEEIAKLLKYASERQIAVVPRGAGTGLSGGCVPTRESIVLSLERMNRILEINAEDAVAVVEPGVITGEIRRAAEAVGLFYPPIPASVDSCTIGGNIATNAGGLCAVKYGVTREHVMGLEAVLSTGEIIQTGGKFIKSSTGYNLTQLLVGSEGTLAVITKIILRLLPLPTERITLIAPFSSLDAVTNAVVRILRERIAPPTLELLPKAAVDAVLHLHPHLSFPFPTAAASLLIELDGRSSASVAESLLALQEVLSSCGAGEPAVGNTPSRRDQVWSVRKLVRESIVRTAPYIEADSVVPRRNVPNLVRASEEVALRHGLRVICYGHAGDGNLHTYFLRTDQDDGVWKEKSTAALTEFLEATLRLEGTVSGEHGIGLLKRDFLSLAISPPAMAVMRKIKEVFDPQNILNPGKVFPSSP